MAEQLHMHPDDVDPRYQSPRRARWFWRQLELRQLTTKVRQA